MYLTSWNRAGAHTLSAGQSIIEFIYFLPIKTILKLMPPLGTLLVVHLVILLEGGLKWNCISDMCKTKIVSN